MKSIRDIALRHQTVFLRVDLNVPLDDNQEITDDSRIKAALPTIEYILSKGAKLILASHLGRPKGQVVQELRMKPIAQRLQQYLGQDIHYMDDCIGAEVNRLKERLEPGEVLLLENLRFYKQEQENEIHFAEQLAHGIDVYLTDAFGAIHRKHASTYALPSIVFDKGIGFLIQEEIDALDRIINTPKQPLVVVVGGVKISDKVDVIRNLAPMSDTVLVGGGLANTFYAGLGTPVGESIVESDSVGQGQDAISYVDVARDIAQRFATERPTIQTLQPNGEQIQKVQLPVDFIAAESIEPGAPTQVIEIGKDTIPADWTFLDIGPKTRAMYKEVLSHAKTIFWNGPMGLFEMEPYEHGSRDVAQAVADSKGYAVLGGGDTQAVVDKFGLDGRFSHASTGGGASLTYLAQHTLPGLEALN
jgi:phosphoglycerate kinase